MEPSYRYRFVDVRRVGSDLLTAVGVSPDRASAFITSLLWYDAAGAPRFGIGTLSDWLDAIAGGLCDPGTEGTIRLEYNGTAVLDGGRGIAPLLFRRAARIAGEKAREAGVGVVRVVNPGGSCPAASAVCDVAIGPNIGVCHGPGPSWTVAIPTMGGAPAVFSTELGGESADPPARAIAGFPSWSFPFVEAGGWLFAAYSVKAFEPLAAFHERVEAQLIAMPKVAGEVRPSDQQAARAKLLTKGVSLPSVAERALRACADRAGLLWPEPIAIDSGS